MHSGSPSRPHGHAKERRPGSAEDWILCSGHKAARGTTHGEGRSDPPDCANGNRDEGKTVARRQSRSVRASRDDNSLRLACGGSVCVGESRTVGIFAIHTARLCLFVYFPAVLSTFRLNASSFCRIDFFDSHTSGSEVPRGRLRASRGRSLRHQMKRTTRATWPRPAPVSAQQGARSDDRRRGSALPAADAIDPVHDDQTGPCSIAEENQLPTSAQCTRVPAITI